MSYDADWRAGTDEDSDHKLIHSMMRRGHTSPFEHVTFTFEVKAPIFVFRQWQRHRTFSYSELSARYAQMQEEFYVPEVTQITQQHATDKQMRGDVPIGNAEWARGMIEGTSEHAYAKYAQLLQSGVARELARCVLPVRKSEARCSAWPIDNASSDV